MKNKSMKTLLAAILCFLVALVQVNVINSKSLTEKKSSRFSHHEKKSPNNRHTVKRNAHHKSSKRQFLPFYGGMYSSFNHQPHPHIHRIVVHHHPGQWSLSFVLFIPDLTSLPLTYIILGHESMQCLVMLFSNVLDVNRYYYYIDKLVFNVCCFSVHWWKCSCLCSLLIVVVVVVHLENIFSVLLNIGFRLWL